MLTMTNYLYDYVLESAKVFNEFDQSSFINSASIALNKDNVDISLSFSGNHCTDMLEKTLAHINTIEIDSYAISEFVAKILESGRVDSAKLTMKDISKFDTIILKPQYLTAEVRDYKEMIDGIASGKYNADHVKDFYINWDAYLMTLKKRLVTSNINVNMTSKEMLKYDKTEKIPVTTKYLEDVVIPFLQYVPKKKKELAMEISHVSSIVTSAVSDIKRLVEDVNTGINSNKIDAGQKKLMMQYTFNQVRAFLDGVTFITYAAMRKVHQFEDFIVECQNVYNTLTLVFNDNMTLIEAGTFDKKVITATDANNMAEKLVEGSNDVFAELAHNIMEYHKGYISSNIANIGDVSGGDTEDYINTLLENNEFNPDKYYDIVKSYIEIGNGLDILAKNCDDRLMIFDELVKKAGFVITLPDRFHNEIEALDDLSSYGLADLEIGNNGEKASVYYTILSEINGYPKVTEQIASAAKAIYIKAEYVEDLFNAKKNGELAYSETMNELKIFLDSFKDQFRALNTQIVKGLYMRLKYLAAKADDCLDNVNSTPESDYYNDEDFFEEAVMANLDEIDTINDVVMESLLKEYYAEREFLERGVRLVYEAEGDASTAVKINDGNTGASSGTAGSGNIINKEKLSNLLKSIGEWFEKMITSFEEVIGRQAAKNTKWLADNKDGLMNRSYSNVEIQILPYDQMPHTNISNDITKMTTNVSAMTIQNMQNIKSYEDMRAKLINFGPKFSNNADEKVAITNYYKVGNKPLQTVPYANNNIKTFIVNSMIPYCESFYTSYKDEIKKQLTALKTAAENISKTYVTESVGNALDALIFIEADATATPTVNTNTTNTTTTDNSGLSTKAGWIKQCIQMYSGSVLNAIRDRNNDYFKVLYALAPKTTTPATKETTTDANQTQNTEK